MVMVPVTVTDRRGAIVNGLGPGAFAVLEDRVRQQPRAILEDDAPASIGVVFDVSGSMRGALDQAETTLQSFVKTANPQDEAFLLTVSTRPGGDAIFTTDLDRLGSHLLFVEPSGSTALIDTIYSALLRMRAARNLRKALLIISDGMDNHSRHTKSELMAQALEEDVQMYSISVNRPPNYLKPIQLEEQRRGLTLLQELTTVTGGLQMVVRNPEEIARATTRIGRALRDQYLIEYAPANSDRSGKWHAIEVKLNSPGLKVHARAGYRAE
jgi:Ca-activated chloride channel family protein